MRHARAVLRFIARNAKRVAITVAGLAVFLAGVVMLVTPGPGWALIFAGLAILATEYVWAQRALAAAKARARQATGRIRRRRPTAEPGDPPISPSAAAAEDPSE